MRHVSTGLTLLLSALSVGLTACDQGGVASDAVQVDPRAKVPAFVQELIDGDVPADGEVHIHGVGRIRISPDTPVCYSPDGFAVDSRKLFGALGQKENVPSGSRLRPALDGQCSFGPDTVLMNGFQSENREGDPYRLTFVVWQGSAAWVGGVERLDHEWHPKFDPTNAIDDDFLDIRQRPRPTKDEGRRTNCWSLRSAGQVTWMPGI